MKALHSEWFPIDYPQEFFDRMKKSNVIAIGCFYQVELTSESSSAIDANSGYELVLIGCIFSKVETENGRNESLLEHID